MSEQDYEFDAATEVAASADGTAFDIDVSPGFTVGGKPNGGYLVSVMAKAAGLALGHADSTHRDPLATTSHFLRAPDPAPATVHAEVLRTGRSASQVHATLVQDGGPCVVASFTMGTLTTEASAPGWTARPPIDLPPMDDCFRLPARREGAPFEVAIMDRTDLRLDPAVLGWAGGAPSGAGELRGWISFADGRPTDALGLVYFLDALPPATFDISPSGWVPTLSLTTYVRALPAPGPLRIVQRANLIADGRVDETCEIWDATDALVGHATQLAAIRFSEDAVLVPHPG